MKKFRKRKQIEREAGAVKNHEIKTFTDDAGNKIVNVYNDDGTKWSSVQINSPATFYLQFYDRILYAEFSGGIWNVKKWRLSKEEKQRQGLNMYYLVSPKQK